MSTTTPTTPSTRTLKTAGQAEREAANRDPITGAPGAHPVGVGVGAAGAGTAGAAIGLAVGGPPGAVVGAAVGAVVGGLAGKSAAESMDPTVEDAYWRGAHGRQTFVDPDLTYDDYAPAYRTGYMGYGTHTAEGRDFDAAEAQLEQDYNANRGKSKLTWNQAKPATRAAWARLGGDNR